MTGWRVGWAIGKTNIIQAMTHFQSHSVSCASSISQVAAAWAIDHCDKDLESQRQHLIESRTTVMSYLHNLNDLDVYVPEGAFYIWFSIKKLLGKHYKQQVIRSSMDFVEYLLQAESVVCVPGDVFGYPGYVRIHFAMSSDIVEIAILRIKNFISQLV